MKTLRLTLKRKWFLMVASGEKKEEYRKQSKWILSRLVGKSYDRVQFQNGYAATSPLVECEFLGWDFGFGRKEWGGGSEPGNPIVVIRLGKITRVCL